MFICVFCCLLLSLVSESSDGDVHRRLPALPAEHPGSDSLPANDVDRGDGGNPGVLHHRVHVLLVCKCMVQKCSFI